MNQVHEIQLQLAIQPAVWLQTLSDASGLSKSEIRRLRDQNAIKVWTDKGEEIPVDEIEGGCTVRLGHRFSYKFPDLLATLRYVEEAPPND